MYISNIHISNFRNFVNTSIKFTPGLNVIIGHNNAGKTNLLRALQYVFGREKKARPTINDFNKAYNDFSNPPRIDITATISENGEIEQDDDKNIIYDWLITEGPPYKAQVTFTFYLPGVHLGEYEAAINKCKDTNGNYNRADCFDLIETRFINQYVSHLFGGDPKREERAVPETLDWFDFQLLDAIRDAEREMFYGNKTLLRDVLNYFLDYDILRGRQLSELDETEQSDIQGREEEFESKSKSLLQHLIERVSKDKILEYSKETGADKGGKPAFAGKISEQQVLITLRLIVKESGFEFPITNNGLGYNNLLFIALILAKIEMQRSGYMGDNAKLFPILAIEEPEAHLHPSMQYKFLRFLDNNLKAQEQARQIFITSHSTHITAAVDIDSIICLYDDIAGKHRVGYPGKVFSDSQEDLESKNFVIRFLDATKSNMLFAERIILVEGLAEQLLIPCFASYLEKEEDLLNEHVCIVSVDSRTFKHFIKLFAFHEETKPDAINKRLVCLSDVDPSRKKKPLEGETDTEYDKRVRWHSCYPFELNQDRVSYEYKPLSTHVTAIQEVANSCPNIRICTSPEGRGKTLEYDLIFNNPDCVTLITDSFPSQGKNRKEVMVNLVNAIKDNESFDNLKALSTHDTIVTSVESCDWSEDDKKKALIAAIYLEAVKNAKGEHALYLESRLRVNLAKGDDRESFTVPEYISEAITFILS